MDTEDDEVDFTALMLRVGVAPVAGKPRGKPARKEPAPVRAPTVAKAASAKAVSAKAISAKPVSATAIVGKAVSAKVVLATAVSAKVMVAKPVSPAVQAEPAVARAELRALQVALERMTAARDGLVVERDALVVRVKASEREVVARERAVATLEVAVAGHRAELAACKAVPGFAGISLATALAERGLRDGEEQARAVAGLMGTQSAGRLLKMLESRDLEGLRSALERRVVLVCASEACRAIAQGAVIEVEPARCESCGGSEIQRAAGRFVRACAAAGVARVRFVGGSPNYRTQLEALFPEGGALTVRTTEGDRRVPLQRAKAQQRGDDLVVIWGATELDHATSGAYRAQFGRVEVIAHRGIGRMLDLTSERISKR